MLNSSGPSIDTCRTPYKISNSPLNEEHTFLSTTEVAIKMF